MSLVKESFQTYYTQKHNHFMPKNVRNLAEKNNIATVDFMSIVRRDESSPNDFVKLTIL